jgi:hypothetical protein
MLGLTYIETVAFRLVEKETGEIGGRAIVMARARQFLGIAPVRWLEYLVAILVGNAVYYLSLAPHLPEVLRHQGFRMDGGVLVDFVVCVAAYRLVRLGVGLHGGFFQSRRDR